MKLLKKLLKGIVACILIAAVIVAVYLVQAYVIDRKDSKAGKTANASGTTNGANNSGKSNSSNGKNSQSNSSNGSNSGSNGTTSDGSENGLNGQEGFEYNGIPVSEENGTNTNGNGSKNGFDTGTNLTNSSESTLNSSNSSNIGDKAKSFGQKAWDVAKKAWNISVTSFKEGYHSVPDYNSYNFDDRFLFYEGTQNQDIVLHIIDLLIEDSDNNLFSKPTLTLKGFGADKSIEYTTSEEYKSALENVRSLITNGNYEVSFGYSALHIYVNEIIITK